MILQWVKLHDNNFVQQPVEYGTIIQYNYNDYVMSSKKLYRGNKLKWKRKHLWKCIEYLNNGLVEHIVYVESPRQPMITLISKFIKSSAANTSSHCYRRGASELFKKNNSNMSNNYTIPYLLFNSVRNMAQVDNNYYIIGNMDEWLTNNKFITNIAPLNKDADIRTEWCGISDTEKEELNYPIIPMDVHADRLYSYLADTLVDIQNGADSRTLEHAMNHMFASCCYYADGVLVNKAKFQSSSISQKSLIELNNNYTDLDDLIAPTIYNIHGINKDTKIVVPDINKEVMSLISVIQSINVTDMQLTFDLNKFSIGDTSSIKTITQNRYPHCKDEFLFPYIPNTSNREEYGFYDWESPIGDAVCNIILSLDRESIIHDIYDTVKLTKTYNEDIILQFGVHDGTIHSNAYYIDVIGCLLTSQDMGIIL